MSAICGKCGQSIEINGVVDRRAVQWHEGWHEAEEMRPALVEIARTLEHQAKSAAGGYGVDADALQEALDKALEVLGEKDRHDR